MSTLYIVGQCTYKNSVWHLYLLWTLKLHKCFFALTMKNCDLGEGHPFWKGLINDHHFVHEVKQPLNIIFFSNKDTNSDVNHNQYNRVWSADVSIDSKTYIDVT